MAQRTVAVAGRPWTSAEDAQLTSAVASFGEHDNWKKVALSVPGRTNKACRKRWLHSLSPAVKKSAWTPSEDRLLVQLYNTHGPKWSAIARQIRGRTDDACSKRYREALDPNLKKDEWTTEEDAKLIEVYARIGGKWGQVGQELRRSGLGCRNRWRMLDRNRTKALQPSAPSHTFDQTQFLHAALQNESLPPVWPVYYPPEAYPSVLRDEPSEREHSFREPTPQMPDSPEVPPFQFSSSSLSAALSDPPRMALPLPVIADDVIFDNKYCESDPDPESELFTSTYSSAHEPMVYESDTISPAELSIHHCYNSLIETLNKPGSSRISEISSPPASNASSSSSSPLAPTSSLTPADSPTPCSPVELLSGDQLPPESLLFSSAPYYCSTAPSKRQRKVKPRKPPKPLGESRLSCLLPLSSDPNMRAYACGRERCWPSDAETSNFSFATSKELLDHSRSDHIGEPVGDRPYRCALTGCGKSWKTLNGLQYHLQISPAHFRNAVSSSFNLTEENDRPASPVPDAATGEPDNRIHKCHHPQCFKAYRQPSGLRYHLKHGHPSDLPVQLEMVPPSLAREIPKKTRKMRRKDPPEDS
ncbi:hypothetical protein C8J57DRAFT_1043484 [Mycena rebaudengoi]|nr:hypothetical protein C8J57DRAFT_1043484 [Mycena rebaudengoi]